MRGIFYPSLDGLIVEQVQVVLGEQFREFEGPHFAMELAKHDGVDDVEEREAALVLELLSKHFPNPPLLLGLLLLGLLQFSLELKL